jgi:O-antigen/teichoic acid export membrane protein
MKTLPFFKGLSWLILLNLLVKPVWIFFIDRQVQNITGNEAYGRYFAILNLSYVLLFLSDAGLGNMLNQRMANRIPLNIFRLLRIKIFLLFLYCAACFLAGWLTGIKAWDILFYVIIIQALTSLFVFLRSIVTAGQFFYADAWFSVLDKMLMIIFCGSILYTSFFGNMDLLLFLKIQTLCTSIALCCAFFFIMRKDLITRKQKKSEARLIPFILPFAAIILLMSAHYRLDGFLLERIHHHGALEAGIYASAYRLLDAGNMAGYLAASFLLPFVARHQAEKEVVEDAVIHTRHGLIFFGIGAATFVIMFAPWLQRLLYHSDEAYHSLVMQLCIAALPGYFLVHVYGSLLTATARFRQFIFILLLSVVLNAVLNLLLIPVYGALACCIAALASQYFCGLACCIVATKSLGLASGSRSGLLYLLCAGVLAAFFYFLRMAISNVWVILAITVCLSAVFLTRAGVVKRYFISLR